MEEVFGLAGGKGTGGFIHDDDLCILADGSGDLDHLLLAGGEFGDGSVDGKISFDFVEHSLGRIAHTRSAHEAGSAREIAETQVFGDGKIGAEREFLMDHGDAEMTGGKWIIGCNELSVHVDFTRIGGVNTGKDFAEGAFASAVFADERVAFAFLDLEADTIESKHAGKALGDVVERQPAHAEGYIVGNAADCKWRLRGFENDGEWLIGSNSRVLCAEST